MQTTPVLFEVPRGHATELSVSGRLTRGQKALTAVVALAAAAGLSTFGIIDLVARSYGRLASAFIALVVLPLFVVVPYRSFRATR